MTADHYFGSGLTDLKLSMVGDYLQAFTTALSQRPFERWYIDAFAGTGERTVKLAEQKANLFSPPIEEKIERRRGSARIALDTHPPFNRLIFLETKKRHIRALEELKAEYVERGLYKPDQIRILREDANTALQRAAQWNGWRNVRAAMFLDPYGMGVEWATLQAIQATKAIDLWYLVSLSGLYRQATRQVSKLDEKKRAAITRMLGTDEWEQAWYEGPSSTGLFPELVGDAERTADLNRIEGYVRRRLETLFPTVLGPKRLHNDRGAPMFSLYFAISNPAPSAKRVAAPIARHILGSGR